jgi:hypothetical protein
VKKSNPNTVSDAHVWRVIAQSSYGITEQCQRCGSCFHTGADRCGPLWCMPTAQWRASHPNDDGRWRRDGFVSPMEPK